MVGPHAGVSENATCGGVLGARQRCPSCDIPKLSGSGLGFPTRSFSDRVLLWSPLYLEQVSKGNGVWHYLCPLPPLLLALACQWVISPERDGGGKEK